MYSHLKVLQGMGGLPSGFSLAFFFFSFPFIGFLKQKETQMLEKVGKWKKRYAGCLFFR